MSRRRGDRHSLAATLAGAYWSRGVSTTDDVLQMLLEARQLSEELGDMEVRGDATAWLVPTYVVLCDHDAARDALAQALRDHAAAESAVPAPRRRALRGRSRALRRRSGRGGGRGTALLRVGEAAHGSRRLWHLRDPDVLDQARAGPRWRARAVRAPARRRRARRRMAPRARRDAGRARDGGRGALAPAGDPRRRRRVPPDVALDRLPRLPRGRVRDARRRGRGTRRSTRSSPRTRART